MILLFELFSKTVQIVRFCGILFTTREVYKI